MPNSIYFETSAINYLLEHATDEGIASIRDGLLMLPNARLCLSPITMWEIMCTKDGDKRDSLIRVCQILLDNFWVYSAPIKVMDHFISEGCPLVESDEGMFDGNGSFNTVWREISSDLSKTMKIQGAIIDEDSPYMKKLFKLTRSLIQSNFCVMDSPPNEYHNMVCGAINSIFFRLSFVREMLERGEMDCERCLIYKTAIYFACCLLITGISIDGGDLARFWRKRMDSTDIKEQAAYLFGNYETIVHRGPIVCMALMAIAQAQNKSNRGLYKDCLHAFYIPYSSLFFTADKHFIEIKSSEPREMWGRIMDIEEFCKGLCEFTTNNQVEQ